MEWLEEHDPLPLTCAFKFICTISVYWTDTSVGIERLMRLRPTQAVVNHFAGQCSRWPRAHHNRVMGCAMSPGVRRMPQRHRHDGR
jgi:hypothetical protein